MNSTASARAIIGAVAACATMLVLAGCSLVTAPRMRNIDLDAPAVLPPLSANGENFPLKAPDAARGAAIYEQKCVACHGASGAGDGARAAQIREQGHVVANLTQPERLRAARPSDWHTVISVGRLSALMPGFSGSLNAQDRWDVQAYVWSLGTPAEALKSGNALYAQHCAGCHGAAGDKAAGAVPELRDLKRMAERSLIDIAGKMTLGDAHKAIKLGEAERFQVADAVRAFAYAYADPAGLREARLKGAGQLTLRAINGTSGGPQAGGLPVVLRALDQSGEVFSRTARLDSGGTVTFTNLPQRDDYFYQAELDYQGGRFYGAPAQLAAQSPVVSDVLAYYETTTDTSTINLANVLVAVQDLREGEATIVEIYEFAQGSDRAYIGEKGRTLRISVPADAQNVRFDGLGLGRRFFQEGEIIYDSDVVPPGSPAQRITMIYEVPYRNNRAFERRVFYPVGRWNLIVPDVEGLGGTPMRASGPVKDDGAHEADGTRVRLYTGEAVTGSVLRFTLSGQPLGAPRPGDDNRSLAFALIALALAFGLGVFLFVRVRAVQRAMLNPQAYKQQLVRDIARLDDEHARGKISAAIYTRERERLKSALKDVWR